MKTLCLGCMNEYEGEFEVCPYCGYVQGTPPKKAFHITPGVVLKKRYLVGRVLGFGGFGITYIGFDTVLQKKVAIKEYFPSEFATRMPNQTKVIVYAGEKQEQFHAGMKKSLEEAQRLAEFQQTPGITWIQDFFEENNTAYIVMELLEGETLKDKLQRDGVMKVEEALPIILAVISALKAVHAKGIIHRDIAPDNIFLLKNGEVKLLDFGAARQVTTTHSKSLTVILKMGYAPVEQYQSGGNQGPWTDVYALAATFYKMITGRKPPQAPDRRIHDELKPPSKLGVHIDKNTENALLNALHVRMEDRTQSAEEFEQALYSESVQLKEATKENNDTGGWPFWLKGVCAAAAAVVLAVGGLMAAGVIDAELPTLPAFFHDEDSIWMPSLVNLSQEDAKARLEELGLVFEIGGTKASETILKGYVLEQNDADGNKLAAGTEIEPGAVVQVIISSGSGMALIPDVTWMEEGTARELLSQQELVAVNVESDTSAWAPGGVVTEISPAPGTEVKKDDVITLKVSAGNAVAESGEEQAADLAGLSQEDAYKMLKEQGLFLQKEQLVNSMEVPEGRIISQTPEAGTSLQKGETVRVLVSAGPRQTVISQVTELNLEDASVRLTQNGTFALTVQTEEAYSEAPAGTVIAQSIPAGTAVNEGETIVLTVSIGARPEETTRRPAGNTGGGNSGGGQAPATQAPATQAPAPREETEAPTQPPAETVRPDISNL